MPPATAVGFVGGLLVILAGILLLAWSGTSSRAPRLRQYVLGIMFMIRVRRAARRGGKGYGSETCSAGRLLEEHRVIVEEPHAPLQPISTLYLSEEYPEIVLSARQQLESGELSTVELGKYEAEQGAVAVQLCLVSGSPFGVSQHGNPSMDLPELLEVLEEEDRSELGLLGADALSIHLALEDVPEHEDLEPAVVAEEVEAEVQRPAGRRTSVAPPSQGVFLSSVLAGKRGRTQTIPAPTQHGAVLGTATTGRRRRRSTLLAIAAEGRTRVASEGHGLDTALRVQHLVQRTSARRRASTILQVTGSAGVGQALADLFSSSGGLGTQTQSAQSDALLLGVDEAADGDAQQQQV